MQIFKALVGVMKDLTPIVASRKHPQGWQYRGVDDIYNNLQPLLATHGVITIPIVQSVERSAVTTAKGGQLFHALATVEYKFYAEDGSSVSCVVAGEGTDSLDNAVAKALTDAHCKALVQTFVIPKDDLNVPDEPIRIKESGLSTFLKNKGIDAFGKDSFAVREALQFFAFKKIDDVPDHRWQSFLDKILEIQEGKTRSLPQQIKQNGGNALEPHTKRFMALLHDLGLDYKGTDREWLKAILSELGYESSKDIPADQIDKVILVIKNAMPQGTPVEPIVANNNRERLLEVAKELGGNGAMCKDAIESRYPGKTAAELNDRELNTVISAMLTRWALAQGYKNGDPNQVARSFSEWLERERFTIGEGTDTIVAAAWVATVNAWLVSKN